MTRCRHIILMLSLLLCGKPIALHAASIPQALRDTTFVAFDLETTGLSAARHRVIEIGAVKLRAGRVVARKVWLINPEQPIPTTVTRIHGLTDADVRGALPLREVYPAFAAFVRGSILLAHNARFDVRFMAHEAHRNALPCPPEPVLDTLRLLRKWYPELKSHRLQNVTDHLGIEPGRDHRALDDALTLSTVFTAGLAAMPPATTLSNLVEIAGAPLYIKAAVPLNGATAEPPR